MHPLLNAPQRLSGTSKPPPLGSEASPGKDTVLPPYNRRIYLYE